MRRTRKAAATDKLPDTGAAARPGADSPAARPGAASATASRAAAAPAAAAGAELSDSRAPRAIAATLERSAASAASALAASMLIGGEEGRSPPSREFPPDSPPLPHQNSSCHVSGYTYNISNASTHIRYSQRYVKILGELLLYTSPGPDVIQETEKACDKSVSDLYLNAGLWGGLGLTIFDVHAALLSNSNAAVYHRNQGCCTTDLTNHEWADRPIGEHRALNRATKQNDSDRDFYSCLHMHAAD